MFTLVSDREAMKYLVIVFVFILALSMVLAIINLVLAINNRIESRKMDLERYERRRKERWKDR